MPKNALLFTRALFVQLLFIAVGFYLLAVLAKGAPSLLPVVGVVLALGFLVNIVSVVAFVGVFRKSVLVLTAYVVLLVSAIGLMCYAIAIFSAKVASGESV